MIYCEQCGNPIEENDHYTIKYMNNPPHYFCHKNCAYDRADEILKHFLFSCGTVLRLEVNRIVKYNCFGDLKK